ncbi:hypothetical protein F4808DRAFT_461743 [Astrocystis sublimbata]|nr:hypothetical protein F4808DRAFT_461743 [Astrocystis sublimbata]
MQISSILTFAVLALGVAARKHKYCNCHVNGKLDVPLSHKTCSEWGKFSPHTEWKSDRGSCHDYHKGGGIDGARWQALCKTEHGGDTSAVRGNCFKH